MADAGAGFVVEVVVGVLVGQAVALGLVGLFGEFLVGAEEVLFLAVEFGLQEAVFVDLLHHTEQQLGGLLDAVLLGRGVHFEHVDLAAQEATVAATGIHHGGGGLLGDVAEALVHHHTNKVADQHGAVSTDGAVRSLFVFPEDFEGGAGGLLVGGDSDEGLHVAGDFIA